MRDKTAPEQPMTLYRSFFPTLIVNLGDISHGQEAAVRLTHEGRANLLLILDDVPPETVVVIRLEPAP